MKYTLLIIAIALSCRGMAQTAAEKRQAPDFKKKLTAGINAGLSLPLGRYHSDLKNDVGLATAGTAIGIEATYFFSRFIGANLSFTHQFHSTNAKKRAQWLGSSDASITKATVSSGSFQLWDILLGLEGRFPIAQHWNISWIAGGGVLWTTTPAVAEDIQAGVPSGTKITAARAASFVYKSRLSVHYALTPSISIGVFGEGAHSEPTFSFRSGETATDRKLSISFLNTGIGLRYNLKYFSHKPFYSLP